MAFDENKYKREFEAQHYDKMTLYFPKGSKEELKSFAEAHDMSIKRLIMLALKETYGLELNNK